MNLTGKLQMKKLIRDNKVAVILGVSWYSLHKNIEWVFLPELIELIESDKFQQMTEEIDFFHYERKTQMIVDCLLKLGYKFTEEDLARNSEWKEYEADTYKNESLSNPVFISDKYIGGKSIDSYDLAVKWIDCNREFTIRDSDYGEYILYKDELNWIIINEKT